MFESKVDGLPLRFHLAGINNQNFLMRDEQTGTYWQQITGLAVSGPLAGRRLVPVPADELTFAIWKAEEPQGTVLRDVPRYAKEYAAKDWDVRMAKAPTVVSFAQAGLKPRDLMLGIHAFGASKAFPYETIVREKLIQNRVGNEPVLLVLGPDNRSVRVFRQRLPGILTLPQFYRVPAEGPVGAFLMDAETGSEWDFEGCSVAGKWKGTCLERVDAIKDYWFDWRNYNANTTVYGIKQAIK